MQPETRYARSGDLHIAYQVFGAGSVDLVIVPGFISNLEETWDNPSAARWLDRLSRFARVIAFDKRGTGLSDRAGSAAEDHCFRALRGDPTCGVGPGDHFGVDAELADSSDDELGVLSAKVDDENALMGHATFYPLRR